MARPTPHLDRAGALLESLQAPLKLPTYAVAFPERARERELAAAIVASNLAIAEALHGVIYVANANAV